MSIHPEANYLEYVLRTQNLTKQFGEKTAVKNVSMQIKKGEIYGFIGKNGAGKTTLMRLVLGAAMPTGGSIELFGGEESVNETRHRIGALLEYPCIYKNCTALENLRRFAILTGADTDELEDILDLVGLKGVGRKKSRAVFARHEAASCHRHRPARSSGVSRARRADKRPRPCRNKGDTRRYTCA